MSEQHSVLLSWYWPLLLLSATTMALWAFYFWWKKDRHRREHFAFVGFAGLLSFALFSVSALFANNSILGTMLGAVLKFLGLWPAAPSPLSPLEAVVFTIVFGLIVLAYLYVFTHWSDLGGQKSLAQHEQEQNAESPSVLRDVALMLNVRKTRRERLQPYLSRLNHEDSALQRPEMLTWHERARQLWLLRHRNYLFQDTYDRCWIGVEKNTGTVALMACFHATPTLLEMTDLLNYGRNVSDQQGRNEFELIVALKGGSSEYAGKLPRDNKVTFVNEEALLDGLVNFRDYFDDVEYRVKHARLVDSEFTLDDTYTPSKVRLKEAAEVEGDTVEDYVFAWLVESTNQQLALLGDYGQGKTTTSLLLSYHLIQKSRSDARTRIPILIELRGKTLRTMTPEELLATWALRYHLNVQALLHLHMAGRLLLIFEGFDEIDLSGDTETRISHFRTLWRLNYDQAKIVITGRPNFFLDGRELKRALGTADQTRTLYLAPFNLDQIHDALRSADERTRNEIMKLSRTDSRFLDVVSRPSLLYMVAVLWESEQLYRRGPIDSALVIDLFIRQTLKRQQRKHDERPFMILNTSEREYFTLGIAAFMAADYLPNQIDKHELQRVVGKLVEAIPDDVSRAVSSVTGEDCLPLRDDSRLQWTTRRAEVLERIQTDVRSCGLLVTDPSKDGSFKFAHKSFMEFLQAKVLSFVYAIDETERRAGLSIINSLGLRIEDLHRSDQPMGFLAELLKHRLNEQGHNDDVGVARGLYQILIIGDRSLRGSTYAMMKSVFVRGVGWCSGWLFKRLRIQEAPPGVLATSTPFVAWVMMMVLTAAVASPLSTATAAGYVTLFLATLGSGFLQAVIGARLCGGARMPRVRRCASDGQLFLVTLVAGLMMYVFFKLKMPAPVPPVFTAIQNMDDLVGVPLALIGSGMGFTLFMMVDMVSYQSSATSRRFLMWFEICETLGITPESIQQVVGANMASLLGMLRKCQRPVKGSRR